MRLEIGTQGVLSHSQKLPESLLILLALGYWVQIWASAKLKYTIHGKTLSPYK